jgi:uncharacterized membrane protein
MDFESSRDRVDQNFQWPTTRLAMRWIMAVFYIAAGVLHIVRPESFLPIMPDFIPAPREVILVTGACELAGAIGLLLPFTRKWAAIALSLYAVCVFPANIKHAIYDIPLGGHSQTWWYHAPRLAFQPVLAWWPLFAAALTSWPFGRYDPVNASSSSDNAP